jgi:putative ribosome biogenesis GTPase RsgA
MHSDERVLYERWGTEDIVIAVMGMTGIGKSRFINKITGLELAVGDSLHLL